MCLLQGAWQTTREDAKRSVALVAIQILYEKKQLQTLTLLPLAVDDSSLNVNTYTPTTDTEVVFEKKVGKKTVQVGTKKYKRVLEKKVRFRTNCNSFLEPFIGKHSLTTL